jgi:Prenylcysteine lyase
VRTQVRATKSKGYELHARRAKSSGQKRRDGRWQQVCFALYRTCIQGPDHCEKRWLGTLLPTRPVAAVCLGYTCLVDAFLCLSQEVAGPYAAVIIATPLEGTHIRFKGVKVPPPPAREYQRVTTTYVVGELRAAYFGVQRLPTGVCPTKRRSHQHVRTHAVLYDRKRRKRGSLSIGVAGCVQTKCWSQRQRTRPSA